MPVSQNSPAGSISILTRQHQLQDGQMAKHSSLPMAVRTLRSTSSRHCGTRYAGNTILMERPFVTFLGKYQDVLLRCYSCAKARAGFSMPAQYSNEINLSCCDGLCDRCARQHRRILRCLRAIHQPAARPPEAFIPGLPGHGLCARIKAGPDLSLSTAQFVHGRTSLQPGNVLCYAIQLILSMGNMPVAQCAHCKIPAGTLRRWQGSRLQQTRSRGPNVTAGKRPRFMPPPYLTRQPTRSW
jgi:hypothetical protein